MTTYTVVAGHNNVPVSRAYRRRSAAFTLMERLNVSFKTPTYPYAVLIRYRPNLRVFQTRESEEA